MTRLWSLSPALLDKKGLGGLWFERDRAERGLRGLTTNHANHPQLDRFKAQPGPVAAIGCYGVYVWDEAGWRGYNYNLDLVHSPTDFVPRIPVTAGQVEFEYHFLLQKLDERDPFRAAQLRQYTPDTVPLHPLFYRVVGGKEAWEKGQLD